MGSAPPVLEVRGEVYMRRDDFEALNERQRAKGEKTFVNPRNTRPVPCASSTRRRRQAAELLTPTASGEVRAGTCRTHAACWMHWRPWPAGQCRARRGLGPQGLVDFHARVAARRDALPFDIDGVVYKVNSRALQQQLVSRLASRAGPWRTITRRRSR